MVEEQWQQRRSTRLQANSDAGLTLIDASTFQRQVEQLGITLTNLVEREGVKTLGHGHLSTDIAMMIRQLVHCYDLLLFLNADEIRFSHPGYREGYSFVILPIIRTMIDGFYNITSLLDDPSRAKAFRVDGYRRFLEALNREDELHKGEPRWDEYISSQRAFIRYGMSDVKITMEDLEERVTKVNKLGVITAGKKLVYEWPLLGAYLGSEPTGTPHKTMLRNLTHGFWKEYSNISHAGFSGLMAIAPFISRDRRAPEQRQVISLHADRFITMHIGRAAGLLLATCSELQVKYRFEGFNLGPRIHACWRALEPIKEVQELWTEYFRDRLRSAGIEDGPSL